jgi:oligo-1,6-glucosidase
MQWSAAPGAGFTDGTPWMKINPNHGDINVNADMKNQNSIWHFYKKLIEFRKDNVIIRDGDYIDHAPDSKSIFCFERNLEGIRYIVICNFKEKTVVFNDAYKIGAKGAKLIISNYDDDKNATLGDGITLRPYEVVVFEYGNSESKRII